MMNILDIKSKRIDNVNRIVKNTTPIAWAHKHWSTVLASLLRDWKRSVGEAK